MESYLDDEGQTVDEFEADLEKRVRDAVAAQFILDEVAKKEELGVDQSELSEHLVRRAQQSGQDPQEFANHMFEHNHVPEMIQEILRGKALATIVESAVVKDASGAVLDLKNLRPDGTIGEPEDESDAPARGEPDRATTPRSSRAPAIECTMRALNGLACRHGGDGYTSVAPPARCALPALRSHRPAGGPERPRHPPGVGGPRARRPPPRHRRHAPSLPEVMHRGIAGAVYAGLGAGLKVRRVRASTGSRRRGSGRGWRTGRAAGSSARRSTA